MKINCYFFTLCFTFLAWIVGCSLCTLLKTCEGENLQNCVNKAESILQNTNMTFPDDNETLQLVCRMWDDMTDCTYNYTKRCLTYKENLEFQQYFQEPMNSMKTVCMDKNSTKEYFRHAHCIKKISTGDKYCGTQYHILINQILSVNVNTMKKICCALSDFRDCVMKMNGNHVCGGGPEEKHPSDGDIAAYALKTLDKSLLAFVAHSCQQEGFYRPNKCKEDQDIRNDLDQLRESRTEPSGTPKTFRETTYNDLESQGTMVFTSKPLLVPLQEQSGGANNLQVNITSTGDKGKSKPGFMSKNSKVDASDKGHNSMSASLREKLNTTERWNSLVVDEVLAAKVRNASLKFQHPLINKTEHSSVLTKLASSNDTNNAGPIATRSGIINASISRVVTNRTSRVGGGRALNVIEVDPEAEENKLVTHVAEFYNASSGISKTTPSLGSHIKNILPTVGIIPTTSTAVVKTAGGVKTTAGIKTTGVVQTTTMTSTAPAAMTTTGMPGKETMKTKAPRIVNSSNGNSLRDLNRALGLAPPSTSSPVPSKKSELKSRNNHGIQEQLTMINSTKTDESKNSGNFSASEVPIKVFMVWLSTFFV